MLLFVEYKISEQVQEVSSFQTNKVPCFQVQILVLITLKTRFIRLELSISCEDAFKLLKLL